MTQRPEWEAQVDEKGRLVLPPEITSRYGLNPGVQVCMAEGENGLRLRRPISHLAKMYVEPTNSCNLECRTCIRNGWDEPLGQMSDTIFDRVIDGLRAFSPPPTVFFGGFGEPLAHPHIVEMVSRAKALGGPVEMITNRNLLTQDISRRLIGAGLDMLWVSIDGATPKSYADVRLGAALPEVLANLASLREARRAADLPKPEVGIVFVAMKRNIADLPAVVRLGRQLGVKRFLVTHVLPYTAEMRQEVLYERALNDFGYLPSLSGLDLPKMDVNAMTGRALYTIMRSRENLIFAGVPLAQDKDRCPFIENGATAVHWEGGLSPCLPLLHNHISFLNGYTRFSRRQVIGNLGESTLADLWNDPEYTAFRRRVQTFEFSFCTSCGVCDLGQGNEDDCFGNPFPTCGGCLWAQGIIRCP
jgi:MoaA/NifB/PqqE/SkfB family radical SAM enzyme